MPGLPADCAFLIATRPKENIFLYYQWTLSICRSSFPARQGAVATITGTNDDDTVTGAADDLFCLDGDDLLLGLDGKEVLDGGEGDDRLARTA